MYFKITKRTNDTHNIHTNFHTHFSRVIQTLHKSLRVESQIAKIDIFQA
ncbi:Hypothetical protein BN2458_PEG0015 [Helicobacter typhlonius]|uniref:Uncharacterized protein n=1 Tax=Helicobacter typhlonius TaxID=76936 RepID=A0A0S4PT26_9HELI|nr:Hypothetical protein BN2458_PEG0015 [Helicobacter typhlonius]